MNIAQRRPAELDCRRNVAQTAFHQHHVGCLYRHIRAGADGDADVRCGERRSIVDAVADHGGLALAAQSFDHSRLAVGQDAGNHLVHTGFFADGGGGFFVIAGEHDDAQSHFFQLCNRRRTVLLDDIRDRDDAEDFISS